MRPGLRFGDSTFCVAADVEAMATTPDVLVFASGGVDGEIKLVDRRTHATRVIIPHPASSLVVAGDGTLWAAYAMLRRIRLADGAIVYEHGSYGAPLAAHPGHDLLAVCDHEDPTIHVIRLSTGAPVRSIAHDGSRVATLSFSPDGAALAVGTSNTATVFDLASGVGERRADPGLGTVRLVAYLPSGRLLVTQPVAEEIVVFERGAASRRWRLPIQVDAMAASPFEELVAITANRKGIHVFDGSTLESISRADTRAAYAHLTFTAENELSAATHHRVELVEPRTGRITNPASQAHSDGISAVAVSRDGARLASAGGFDRTVQLFRTSDAMHEGSFSAHENRVTGVAFSPDGATLATACADDALRLFDVERRTLLATVPAAHGNRGLALAFGPEGSLVTIGADGRLVRRDPRSAGETALVFALGKSRADRHALTLDRTGRFAAVVRDDELAVIDMLAKQVAWRTSGVRARAALSPDEPLLGYALEDRVLVVELETGHVVHEHPARLVVDLALRPARALVVVVFDGPVEWVDLGKNGASSSLDVSGRATCVAAAPGSSLYFGLADTTILEMSPGEAPSRSLARLRGALAALAVPDPRTASGGYRDAPGGPRVGGDAAAILVTRHGSTFRLLLEADPEDEDGFVLRIERLGAESEAPPPPPTGLAAARGWLRRVFGLRSVSDDGRTKVVRGRLDAPPTLAEVEAWLVPVDRPR